MKLARIEASVRTVMRYLQALQRHDGEALRALLDPACLFVDAWGTEHPGAEAELTFWQTLWARAPHLTLESEQLYNLGMRCVAVWHITGLPDVTQPLHGMSLFLVVQERIREHRAYIQLPRVDS